MEPRLKNKLREIQDGMSIKRSIMYIILTNPQIYLGRLIKRTVYIGAVTFVLSWLYTHSSLKSYQIPSTTHSLIGIVLGLLLVFRTNTAYDRWWEGRKCIASIQHSMSFYIIKLRSIKKMYTKDTHAYEMLSELQHTSKTLLHTFLTNLLVYLKKSDEHKIITTPFHRAQMDVVANLLVAINKHVKSGVLRIDEAGVLEGCLKDVLESNNSCERIKNTPIPIGFMLHIKTSIFIYLLSLPIGLFHDLGMMSTVIIMTIYYVIGGIEIISTEIENPFAGDPNDLPVEELLNNIKESLK